jgi:hypothetical protein
MDQKEKVREIRLRRMAERQGLKLHKSRRRDPRALEYGGHWLVNERGNVRVGGRNGATLDTIEAFLTGSRYRMSDEGLGPDEQAHLVGYITSLILGGLRRNEDEQIKVTPLKEADGSLTGRLGITAPSGEQYVLSLEPATLGTNREEGV